MRLRNGPRFSLLIPSLLTLLGAGLGSSPSWAQDEADSKREQQLHNVYKKFNTNPTAPDLWDEAIASQPEQTYQIQKGDTLWGVSETFFGDAEFWPKLWSVNKEGIFNPHDITPGDKIGFTPGSLGEPPVFGVSDGDEPIEEIKRTEVRGKGEPKAEPVPTEKHDFVEVNLNELDIPPNTAKRGVTNLPPSMPKWSMRRDPDRNVIFEAKQITRTTPQAELWLHNYIQDNSLEAVGQVTEAEAGMTAAHENQYVVVKIPGASTGQKYLIAKELGKVAGYGDSSRSGTAVQIDGEIVIGDVVNSEQGLSRALVTKAYSVVEVGSSVISGDVQRISLAGDGGAATEAPVRVVGGALSHERSLFGPGEIVYLDAASGSSLNVGQVLNMYRVEAKRNVDTQEVESPRLIGSVKVVRGGQNFLTAVVMTASEEIEVGDSATNQINAR